MGDLNIVVKRLTMFHCFKLKWVMILFVELWYPPWTFSPEVIHLDASRLWHCWGHIFIVSWYMAQSICNALFTFFLTHESGSILL